MGDYVECGICKSKIKMLLYCNGCHQRAKLKAQKEERMRTLRIERFELQKLRDSWLRGNFNYTHEFIDWIDKRMKFYEEETKDN